MSSLWNKKLDEIETIDSINKLPLYSAQFFFKNIKNYRLLFVFLTLVSVLATISGFASTYVLSEMISKIETLDSHEVFFVFLPAYICITVLGEVLDFFTRKYGESFASIYIQHQRLRFYNTILKLDFSNLLNYSKEKLHNLINKYLEDVEKFKRDWYWSTSRNITGLIVILGLLIIQSPIVFVFNIIYIIFFLGVSFYISSKMSVYSRAESLQNLETNNIQQNFFLNLNTAKRLNEDKFFVNFYKNYIKLSNDKLQASYNFHSSRWFLQLNLFNLMFIATFFYGVHQVINGDLQLGFLLLIKYSFDRLKGILIYFIEYFVNLVNQRENAKIFREEFQNLFGNTKFEDNTKILESWDVITLENISVEVERSNDEKFEITIPEFKIKNTEKVGIVGKSGSGKSTTFNILMGLIPYEGNLKVDSNTVSPLNIRNNITLITSVDPLFNISIRDNILLGKNINSSDLERVLKGLKIDDFIKDLSLVIGKSNTNLSAGQTQRIRLARGLLADNDIFLLDEAFNGIDTYTKSQILEFVNTELKDKTVIYITHNIEELKFTSKIYEFNDHSLLPKLSSNNIETK